MNPGACGAPEIDYRSYRMKPITRTLLALIVLGRAPQAAAQDAAGFVELRASYAVGVEGTPWQLVQRARPRFQYALHERLVLQATIEAALAEGRRNNEVVRELLEGSDLGPWLDLAGCSWDEPASPLFGVDGPSDWLHVDRLYLDWYHPRFDLRVGRQALQWGSGQLVNPTDPYPQVLFNEPWRPRAGVNAARITVPFGDRAQVQAVLGISDDFQSARVATRATVQAGGADWSLVAAVRPETQGGLIGVDAKGTLGVGWWVEGALIASDLVGEDAEPAFYEAVVAGIDYSFPVFENLMVSGQYYRNGAGGQGAQGGLAGAALSGGGLGLTCPQGSPLGGSSAAPDPFAPFFSGTNYLSLVTAATFTQDFSVNAAVIQNLGDGSGLAVPTASVRASGAVEVAVSAQVPYTLWGEGGELNPKAEDLVVAFPLVPEADPIEVDFSGLLPKTTVVLWTRASF
jgi:hypothetical protein